MLSTLSQHQYQPQHRLSVLDEHPDTLLSIRDAAKFLGKTASTINVDVTRRPNTLPIMTRIGRRIFFRVGDVLAHIQSHRVLQSSPVPVDVPEMPVKPRRGRPTKISQVTSVSGGVKWANDLFVQKETQK